MNPRTIHETHLADIVSVITGAGNTAVDVYDNAKKGNRTTMANTYSLARAASATTLVFPVLVSESLSSESAMMISKAIERKCVSMMQIALSAFNMSQSNASNLVDFLKDFHTNVDARKMDLDDFIGVADDIAGRLGVSESMDYKAMTAVIEDCRNNLNYYFDDDYNERSLSEFFYQRVGMNDMVLEAKKSISKSHTYTNQKDLPSNTDQTINRDNHYQTKKSSKEKNDEERLNLDKEKFRYQREKDMIDRATDTEKDQYQRNKDKERDDMILSRDRITYLKSQLLPSDVKKANELVPSMMIVNVMLKDPNNGEAFTNQSIIGVKAKMYPVNPNATVTKILTKNTDSNTLLKLVKVGTREISFFKDFLFAIDDAKLEALSKSRRGSSSKLFKVMERRALGGKVRKVLGREATCKPIFSLAISREEADYLMNYGDMDVDNASVVIPIMEKLNLMYFIIVDESTETAKFLIDGDTEFETLSFSALEKEVSDGGYKKVVNLMSKMSR